MKNASSMSSVRHLTSPMGDHFHADLRVHNTKSFQSELGQVIPKQGPHLEQCVDKWRDGRSLSKDDEPSQE
jgi:hypothetical protein